MSTQINDDTDLLSLASISTVAKLDETMERDINLNPRVGNTIGMGSIGNKDTRYLWLKFRWCIFDKPKPAAKRRFDLGHAIEDIVIGYLKSIPGLEIRDRDKEGGQFTFLLLGGHFKGKIDFAALGLVEAPKTWHLCDVKSAKDKVFKEIKKNGIRAYSESYYCQLQSYMGAGNAKRGGFFIYNKDTSELHLERVKFEQDEWDCLQVKALDIITAETPPASPFPGPTYYESRFISGDDYDKDVYWKKVLPKVAHCRNCRFSRPLMDGNSGLWYCGLKHHELLLDVQRAGCDSHNWIPELMPATVVDVGDTWVRYKKGRLTFTNVNKQHHSLTESLFGSDELIEISNANFDERLIRDETLLSIGEVFNNPPIEKIEMLGGPETND